MPSNNQIGKKMTLSEDERKDLILGNLSSYKQCPTYKKAEKFFAEECEKLIDQDKKLDPKTRMWFDEREYCFKMVFVLVSSNKVFTAFDDLVDLFKKDLFKQKGNAKKKS